MKKIIFLFLLVASLLVGCAEEHSNPNIVPARVRLLGSKTIVNVKIDTTLHFIGDTLTFYYTDFYRYWGVSDKTIKNRRVGFVTYRQGVIEKWLKSPNKVK